MFFIGLQVFDRTPVLVFNKTRKLQLSVRLTWLGVEIVMVSVVGQR